ncbi:MAG: zinc-finger domain-containing protein [Rickettsiaceae bacterium]
MDNVEIIYTDKISCSGNSELYDHPKIYLQLESGTNSATCPYCSKKFIRQYVKTNLDG